MARMEFRNVEEGDAGTIPLYDKDVPHIGTYFLMTCVAVYFKVSKDHCFFAHVDTRTPEIQLRYMMVTKEKGRDIAGQVKRRLRHFVQEDEWNIFDPEFGTDLTLQSPCVRDREYDGILYHTMAKYVVQGIREFFEACAQVLEEEVKKRNDATPSRGSDGKEAREFRQETQRLTAKSVALRNTGSMTIVDGQHHVLIIAPLTGTTWRLGRVQDPMAQAEEEDLEDHVPVAIEPGLRKEACYFGVLEDDRSAFPDWSLSEDDFRKRTVEYIESVREEYKDFGSGGKIDAVSNRLSVLLEGVREEYKDFGSGGKIDAASDRLSSLLEQTHL